MRLPARVAASRETTVAALIEEAEAWLSEAARDDPAL